MTPAEQAKANRERWIAAIERGTLIADAWVGFRTDVVDAETDDPDEIELQETSFWSGALFLFNALLAIQDPGPTETPDDCARVYAIHQELLRFCRVMVTSSIQQSMARMGRPS